MKILLTLFVLLFSLSGFAKEEILYCSETESIGLENDSNYSEMKHYDVNRYTLKIDFQNQSLDLFDIPLWQCNVKHLGEKTMQCTLGGFSFYIDLDTNKFTLARGYGFVTSNKDDIGISFGTCEKF